MLLMYASIATLQYRIDYCDAKVLDGISTYLLHSHSYKTYDYEYRSFPNKYPPLKDPKSGEFGPQYLFGKFEPPKFPSTY